MKSKTFFARGGAVLSLALWPAVLTAQTTFTAYDVPFGTIGNQALPGLGVGGDFRVLSPITVSQLGVFSSGTNGIQGSAQLTVQLFEYQPAVGNAAGELEF